MAEQRGTGTEERTLVIERVFDAPRDLVWKVWTEPEHIMRWWGPEHYTCPVAKVDLRVGGKYLYCMRDEQGKDNWSAGAYLEIVPPERMVVSDYFSDEHGNKVPASQFGLPGDWPDEMIVTVTFDELPGGKTKLTVRQAGMPIEMQEMAGAGWGTSLEKMAEYLAKMR